MKIFLPAILFFTALLASAAGLQTSVDRDTVPENEVFFYTMEFEGSIDGTIPLPELSGGEWLTNVRRNGFSILNGRQVNMLSVGVRGTAPGTLVIPSFKLNIDGKEEETQRIEVKVVPLSAMQIESRSGGSATPLRDAVFGELTLPEKRQSYYVGEAIPMRVTVFVLSELQPRLNRLPELTGVSDFVSRSYQWTDGRTSNFAEPDIRQTIQNGKRFIRFDFDTVMRPMKPGSAEPKATLILSVALPDEERSRPSFDFGFGFPFSDIEYTDYKVETKLPGAIEIKSLPPAPREAIPLGLLGRWTLTGSFDRKEAKVGELLSFFLDLKGSGTVETLSPPRLAFENMRVFPPEVRKDPSGEIRISYAVVPLKAGDFSKGMKVAIFDPENGSYAVHELDLRLPVSPGDLPEDPGNPDGGMVSEPGAHSSGGVPPVQPRQHPHRSNPGKTVSLPLLPHALPLAAAIALPSAVAALVIELAARRKNRMRNDPELRRVRLLKKEIPKLIAKLKTLRSEEEFLQLFSAAVQPLLTEALRLPPGAAPSEITAKVEDQNLRAFLESVQAAEFMPAAARQKLFSKEHVELLVAGLRKYAMLFLLGVLAAFPLGAEETPDAFEQAGAAFASGDYQSAMQCYRKVLNDRAPSPHILYNLGEAAYRLGDLPLAKGCFERAHRLSPFDPVIAEDLRQVNLSLKLPSEDGGVLGRLRDMLRPDWYLLIAALAFSVFCLSGAMRRNLPPLLTRMTLFSALALFLLASAALCFQMRTTYSPARAVVLGNSLELRSLPASSSGVVLALVSGGSDVEMLDRNGDFIRIGVNGQDGWVPAEKIMPIF